MYELIQSYIDGTMPPKERTRFEQQLQSDPELAEIFKAYQGIELTMRGGEQETALRQSLQQLQKKYSSEKTGIRRTMFSGWRVAAAAILIVVIGALTWFLLQRPTGDLYRTYAVHTRLDESFRSGINDSLALAASKAFNAGQYAQSATLLQQYIAKDTSDLQMKLALGISYLEQDRFEEAKTIFSNIYTSESVLADKALWYLALTYLKQKRYAQCRMTLSAIAPGADVYDEAQELLKDIQ